MVKIDKKRRKQSKTNYTKRLILLKGKSLRLVIRKTNKYIILQIVESVHAQDLIKYSVNTRELLKYGWSKEKKGSLKSLPAAYLGGLLLGKKAKDLKEKVILDSRLIPNTRGSKIYAAVKGFADAGINIKYGKDVIPSEERIFGNVKDIFEKVKGEINKQ